MPQTITSASRLLERIKDIEWEAYAGLRTGTGRSPVPLPDTHTGMKHGFQFPACLSYEFVPSCHHMQHPGGRRASGRVWGALAVLAQALPASQASPTWSLFTCSVFGRTQLPGL